MTSLLFGSQSSHRKGGVRLHFGRPLPKPVTASNNTSSKNCNNNLKYAKSNKIFYKEKGGRFHKDRRDQVQKLMNQLMVGPSDSKILSLKPKEAMAQLNEKSFAWVHRRDKDEVKRQNLDTLKRRLRAAAYLNCGVDCRALFQVHDQQNISSLSLEEFRHSLKVVGKVTNLSEHAIELIFHAIDVDNSGSIEYEEFVAWLEASNFKSLSTYKHGQMRQKLSAGQLFEQIKKLKAAERFRRSEILETQRMSLVNKWWKELYGFRKRPSIRIKRGKQEKPSLVGGQRTDEVFARLYPYKFARQKLPTTVSSSAIAKRRYMS